jgi:hypothetical protein
MSFSQSFGLEISIFDVQSGAGKDLCVTIASNAIFAQRENIIEHAVSLAAQWGPLFTELS